MMRKALPTCMHPLITLDITIRDKCKPLAHQGDLHCTPPFAVTINAIIMQYNIVEKD